MFRQRGGIEIAASATKSWNEHGRAAAVFMMTAAASDQEIKR
jgi:hypothetical protein